MVFGNLPNSHSGVLFTRSPVDGENKIFGEFTNGKQGNDLVSGTVTPESLDQFKDSTILSELTLISKLIESKFQDMMDIEFTIENRKIYILQSRRGKRTSLAQRKITEDLLSEQLISAEQYKDRWPEKIPARDQIHIPEQWESTAQGTPASPGVTQGFIVTNPKCSGKNPKILCRPYTTPEDVAHIENFEGIITSEGGVTSHAALISRDLEKPCICAVKNLKVFEDKIEINGKTLKVGEWIIMDANTGKIYN